MGKTPPDIMPPPAGTCDVALAALELDIELERLLGSVVGKVCAQAATVAIRAIAATEMINDALREFTADLIPLIGQLRLFVVLVVLRTAVVVVVIR
jgi:hypothetical protein